MLGILRKNFAPKKSRPRKWPAVSMIHRDFDPLEDADYGMDVGPIVLRLGQISTTFVHGQWVSEDGPVASAPSDAARPVDNELLEENQVLREENNMLKLKVELLLDMLADGSADGQRPDIDDQWEQQQQQQRRRRCADPCRGRRNYDYD